MTSPSLYVTTAPDCDADLREPCLAPHCSVAAAAGSDYCADDAVLDTVPYLIGATT